MSGYFSILHTGSFLQDKVQNYFYLLFLYDSKRDELLHLHSNSTAFKQYSSERAMEVLGEVLTHFDEGNPVTLQSSPYIIYELLEEAVPEELREILKAKYEATKIKEF